MENIQNVLADRARTHGDFEHVAKMSQNLKHQMQSVNAYMHLDYFMAESLEAIAAKIARILAGNARETDHWQDIAGYATLVVRQIEREEIDRLMSEQMADVKSQQYAARVEAPQNPDEM